MSSSPHDDIARHFFVSDIPGATIPSTRLSKVLDSTYHALRLAFVIAIFPLWANAETVSVKYGGKADLAPFHCEWIARSSFINRLCYDSQERYAIVNLNGTYYHYCEVPAKVVDEWRLAESMGRYYNAHVKGRFDCRINRVPSYAK